ncbi:MAG: hypothetical protein C0490_01285, partial [Marivirga sp.]|nr:hypothetical protein [Marivirga sp.]
TMLFECYSQIDTEFWFAPPEITSGHGDKPIYLRVSSQDQPATVRILQPASGNIELASFTIPATTTRSITLSNISANLETNIPAVVMNTGLKVVSSAPITAYYEEGSGLNSEVFILKGKNALGSKFIIPWQTVYDNNTQFTPIAYASFDIVATQNNTVVTVTPSKPVFGHEGESIIVVKLNAGETYSFKKPGSSALSNFDGTIVTSSKPIAITLKDDSVEKQTCRDLLGDQLIPVKVTGMEYIVPKGFLNSPEYLFITATEDNTEVFASGISAAVARLNEGQSYRMEITIPSIYIRATKRIYVLHVTGFGCEVGMAVLPPINCTGSKSISFTRSSDEFFGMNVLVRKEGIYSFKLNGDDLLTPDMFKPVPGTGDKWYTAQTSFSTQQIPEGQASVISNDQFSFQAGMIHGNAGTTCRYGYFSSFSTLFIGDDFAICTGDTAMIDAGPGKESYLWSTGATTQSITVNDPGDYWVKVVREDCVLTDTLHLDVRNGMEDLGPDIELCPGEISNIDGKENFSWLWSDGTTERYLKTKDIGTYWVSVFDNIGCPASDTINITRYVNNIDDMVDIRLNYVTVDTTNQQSIRVDWSIIYPDKIPGSIVSLYKKSASFDSYELLSEFNQNVHSFLNEGNSTDQDIFQFYVGLADRCGEEHRLSDVHNTIRLSGIADSVNDIINLGWNHYNTWDNGVDHYEIWRKLDKQTTYEPISFVTGSEERFSAQIAGDGFKHKYIIRAVQKSGINESWSNAISFELSHPISIPNVFTPNGDKYNQHFYIPKIGIYEESELTVFDRWGKMVYEASGYKNDWDGDGLSTGVYYYVLNLKKNNKTLKGIVNIVR